jgi:hypothetical protein
LQACTGPRLPFPDSRQPIAENPQNTFSVVSIRATVAHMADKYKCMVCDQEESHCQCEKYCGLCQGAHDVRLCQDGMYYCLECREACDYQAQY